MNLFPFTRLLSSVAMVMLVTFCATMPSWAESPYPRHKVENHLRAMFFDFQAYDATKSHAQDHIKGFHVFSDRRLIPFIFMDLKGSETETIKPILIELFDEVLHQPVKGGNPDRGDFDLLILVSDDLAVDALHPTYKKVLKYQDQSEQSYLDWVRTEDFSKGTHYLTRRYLRSDGRPLVVVATQRQKSGQPGNYSFKEHMRFTLMLALTGAWESDVVIPSVMNGAEVKTKHDGFAPIDRAVLRAIFGHNDWDGLDYETKIQLLTDRVMEQLAINP